MCGDNECGVAFLERADHTRSPGAQRFVVEPTLRFIDQQHGGTAGNRPGERQTPLLSVGELCGIPIEQR